MFAKLVLPFLVILVAHKTSVVESQLCVSKAEDWAYENVRSDAHMFWWAYCSTAKSKAPLVLWLQGGPGGSSTGFGNFGEIGPLQVNQEPRNTTWLSIAHLLFIDNPVGAGFSYATSEGAFTTDVWQIARDLLTTVKAFMERNTNFQTIPFYIFSESYGGKMTAAFSSVLLKSIQSGDIKCNFQGLAMGDSWISPIDSVLTWGPYLFATSLVDEAGLTSVNQIANKTATAVKSQQFDLATTYWSETENVIAAVTGGVDFYNILKWDSGKKAKYGSSFPDTEKALGDLYQRHVMTLQNDELTELMNGPVRKKLGIIPRNVTWGGQSDEVFRKQRADFMKPVIDVVDELLQSSLKVVVYSGQLDLIVDTIGTELWVQKLQWKNLPLYNKAHRKPIRSQGDVLAYVKNYENFYFYWIMDAGHMVPADNGEAALEMLKMVTN